MVQTTYARRLDETNKLIEQGLYRQAVETAAGAIEILLEDLFDELLNNVSPQNVTSLTTTAKGKPENFARKTLGQKVDFYDRKDICDRLKQTFGYDLRFLSVDFLKTVCPLRNECVHDNLQPQVTQAGLIRQFLEVFLEETLHHPQLTGSLSALSRTPIPPIPEHELVEREEAIAWLTTIEGDRIVIGEPGVGVSSLLIDLAKDEAQHAWFVGGKDLGALAHSIDEKQPKTLILDDAHTDVSLLIELIQLRNVKNYGYSIIAASSPEGRQEIQSLLDIDGDSVYELRRLTQDGMVHVINEIGLEGINWIVQEIISQAVGLPGLAVYLTNSALRGNVEAVRSGEALSTAILQLYGERIDRRTRGILACFALGGNSGMHRDTIANILRIAPLDLNDMLSDLTNSSIITDVPNVLDHFRLRPEALRHALVREVFFASRAALSNLILDDLLGAAPNLIHTITELIGAKARGGNVPSWFLEKHLQDLLSAQDKREHDVLVSALFSLSGTVTSAWREYAWLGPAEATWVIDNFNGPLSLLAPPLLRYIPQQAIPKLLTEAVGDNRELHSHPYHPLRLLQDWVKSAHPITPEPVYRRKEVLRGAKKWLEAGNDPTTGYKAMLFAMVPHYADMIPKPGSGSVSIWQEAFLTGPDLRNLQSVWKEIIACTKMIEVSNWQAFLDTIETWAYPFRGQGPPEEARALLTSFAEEMALDVKSAAANHRGVLRSLKSLMQRSYPDLDIIEDDVADTLYPIRTFEDDWRAQEESWTHAADELADSWINREPREVIADLESLELEINQQWPRLTPYFSQSLAKKISDPLLWFYAMLPRTLPSDIVMQFLQEAINRNVTGWDQALRDSFEIERLRSTAIQIILTGADVPDDLKQSTLDIAGQYSFIIERLVWSSRLSREFTIELFNHADKSLVGRLAIAEWQRDKAGTVEHDIRPLWEQAVIEHCEDDYWLGEIFKVEVELGLMWLECKLRDDSFKPYLYDHSIESVLARANPGDRQSLLEIVPDGYYENDMIAGIIGDCIDVYEWFLREQPYRQKSALLSPLHRPIDATWEAFVKVAHEYDHTLKKIVEHTITRFNSVTSYVGKRSDHWKNKAELFEALKDHEDGIIREVAEVGYQKSRENYEYWKKREDDEDVYGRD